MILYYAKGPSPTWNPQHTPYDAEYIASFYHHVEEGTGRRFQLDNLTSARPGGRYLLNGKPPPPGRYWGYSEEKMKQFEAQGRLVYGKAGNPRYKRVSCCSRGSVNAHFSAVAVGRGR